MLDLEKKTYRNLLYQRKKIVQKDVNNKDTLDVPVMNDGSDEII